MRPSSSPSDGAGGDPAASLLGPLFESPAVNATVSDAALLQAMLDVEAALAHACAASGLFPESVADAIADVCHARNFDIGDLGRRSRAAGNPVVPLVREISAAVPAELSGSVHVGATSQDVLDTAFSLVAKRALAGIGDHLEQVADRLARLAREHRHSLMLGRTLMQQALPTTFGRKVAGWLVAVDESRARLTHIRDRRLAVQFGGAVGTLASLGSAGPQVTAELAAALGLVEPALPWHTDRTRFAELAAALGVTAGTLAKIALDVTLLAQSEVGEVREGGGSDRGGSSTMPHKRNPVAAVLITAGSRRAPGLVATVLSAMAQEHERAAGAWHAEWEPLRALLRLVGGAAEQTSLLLRDLQVDAARMRENLDRAGDVLLAEAVSSRLAPRLGRSAAGDLVRRLALQASESGTSLRDALLEDPVASRHLDPRTVDLALDPAGYLGAAERHIDQALAAHAALATPPAANPGRRTSEDA